MRCSLVILEELLILLLRLRLPSLSIIGFKLGILHRVGTLCSELEVMTLKVVALLLVHRCLVRVIGEAVLALSLSHACQRRAVADLERGFLKLRHDRWLAWIEFIDDHIVRDALLVSRLLSLAVLGVWQFEVGSPHGLCLALSSLSHLVNLISGDRMLYHGVTSSGHIGGVSITHVKMMHPEVLLKLFHLILVDWISLNRLIIDRFGCLAVQRQEMLVGILPVPNFEIRFIIQGLWHLNFLTTAIITFGPIRSIGCG